MPFHNLTRQLDDSAIPFSSSWPVLAPPVAPDGNARPEARAAVLPAAEVIRFEETAAATGSRDTAEAPPADGPADTQATVVAPRAGTPIDEIPDAPADDTTPYTLVPGTPILGSIDSEGDEDWYRLDMAAGTVASVIMLRGDERLASLPDQRLELYDEAGNLLYSQSGGGPSLFSTVIPVISEVDTTYYVSASGDDLDDTGDYRLSVIEYSLGDIAAGDSIAGGLDEGEYVDAYALSVTAGTTYVIMMEAELVAGGMADTWLSLFTADSQIVASDDDGGYGRDALISFTAVEDATYYIAATFSYDPFDTGNYVISVHTETDNTIATPLSLAAGGTVSGTFDYYEDEDWYAVSLEAGVLYSFVLELAPGESAGRVDLDVYDAFGNRLEPYYLWFDGMTAIKFEAETPGTYYLAASGWGSENGSYTLTEGDPFISGTDMNDDLSGTATADMVLAGDGDDSVDARGGNDLVDAGDGDDTVTAGDGDDRVDAGAGADKVEGGAGADYLSGRNGGDTIHGGTGDDAIKGGDGADSLSGDAGDDNMNGDAGGDTLDGGDGNDVIIGGYDGLGNGDAGDVINGGAGSDTIDGGEGDDTIDAGEGDDSAFGGNGNDLIDGGTEADLLDGQAGDDTLTGGDGDDLLAGERGNDELDGGAGNDFLRGGTEMDRFIVSTGDDLIFDFTLADDTLVFGSGWAGGVTGADDVLATAGVVGSDVVFDDGLGNTLTLQDVATLDGLGDVIVVV